MYNTSRASKMIRRSTADRFNLSAERASVGEIRFQDHRLSAQNIGADRDQSGAHTTTSAATGRTVDSFASGDESFAAPPWAAPPRYVLF